MKLTTSFRDSRGRPSCEIRLFPRGSLNCVPPGTPRDFPTHYLTAMNYWQKMIRDFKPESKRRLLLVALFAIAMGWVEAAVVVYMRLLFYPEGFNFPLKVIPWNVGIVEIVREAATLVMLVTVGILAGRRPLERFAYLLGAFGLWDIVYYIGLRLALGWPESLLTWDLLFLIPLPWVGPVLAPVLVALMMIAANLLIVLQEDRKRPLDPIPLFWVLEIAAGLVIILSFVLDWRTAFSSGVPDRFHWDVFLLGYVPGVVLFLYTWWHADTHPPVKPKRRKKKATATNPAARSTSVKLPSKKTSSSGGTSAGRAGRKPAGPAKSK